MLGSKTDLKNKLGKGNKSWFSNCFEHWQVK